MLRRLPKHRLEACKRLKVRVEAGSSVRVDGNVYSVASRLIGEWVEVRLYAERLEVWYAQKLRHQMPRLRGRGKRHIDYRHVIDWLVRKPGAFADYRYREEMFPGSHFRMAYDELSIVGGTSRSRWCVPGRARSGPGGPTYRGRAMRSQTALGSVRHPPGWLARPRAGEGFR